MSLVILPRLLTQVKQQEERRKRMEKIRREREKREAAEGKQAAGKDQSGDSADEAITSDPFKTLDDHLASKVQKLDLFLSG